MLLTGRLNGMVGLEPEKALTVGTSVVVSAVLVVSTTSEVGIQLLCFEE